jgi:hypothetical protein
MNVKDVRALISVCFQIRLDDYSREVVTSVMLARLAMVTLFLITNYTHDSGEVL